MLTYIEEYVLDTFPKELSLPVGCTFSGVIRNGTQYVLSVCQAAEPHELVLWEFLAIRKREYLKASSCVVASLLSHSGILYITGRVKTDEEDEEAEITIEGTPTKASGMIEL